MSSRCEVCYQFKTDYRHYKMCLPKNKWPEEFTKKRPVAVAEPEPVDDKSIVEESRQISIKNAIICPTCGFEAKSDFGMKSHSRKHGGAE